MRADRLKLFIYWQISSALTNIRYNGDPPQQYENIFMLAYFNIGKHCYCCNQYSWCSGNTYVRFASIAFAFVQTHLHRLIFATVETLLSIVYQSKFANEWYKATYCVFCLTVGLTTARCGSSRCGRPTTRTRPVGGVERLLNICLVPLRQLGLLLLRCWSFVEH